MILQESAPGLGRRLAAAQHVLTDAALADVDAEFEQLDVDARRTPTRVLPAHPADQIPELARNDRLVPAGRGAPSRSRTGESPCDAKPRQFLA
jgi:hypothetical protein